MKRLFITLIALAITTMASAFSFSAIAPTEQTLYYTIMGGDSVKVVSPAMNWNGYESPSGRLVIPATVVNNGITYRVTAIDRMAFQSCNNLIAVTIPGSVTTIGQRAFAEDAMLTTAVLEDGVKRIDMMAFASCTLLDTIELPSSITRIAVSAFDNTAYYNDESNWSLEMMLTLGQWVLKVGNQASGTVHVHEGVKGIANNAFLYCRNVEKVVLPTTMSIIGDGAFKDCYSLDTMRVLSEFPPTHSDDSFDGVTPLPVLVVPCSTATVYGASQYWNTFPIVEAPCPVGIEEVEAPATVTAVIAEGGVMVYGAEGEMLRVCDMTGRTVRTVPCATSAQYISLPAAGIYVLLSTKGESVKISYSAR